jgi:hypothetical protein
MVLAVMAIVALTTVVFLSKSQVGVASSANFANAANAAAIGQDAVNTLVASLQAEIVDPANSTTTSGVSVPLSPKDLLPQLDSATVSDTTALSTQPLLSLLKSSRNAANGSTGAATSFAKNQNYLSYLVSNVATDAPSRNGRYVPLARWNDPRLFTTAQNNAQPACPFWIYVNRAGPVPLTSYDPTLSKSFASGTPNPSFVVGRYAYRVYDISGLLDVNVAGFPAAAGATNETGRKGDLAWLNLQDPGVANLGLNSTSTLLFDWRGPSANYGNYADDFGSQYGFLVSPPASGFADPVTASTVPFPNANRLLNRNDLVQFAYDNANAGQFVATTSGSTTIPAPEAFLTQATMFSREVNAPSWGPDPTTAGNTTFVASPTYLNPVSSSTASATSPRPSSIADTRVTTAFTRRDGTTAAVGEPLVKTRFPLAKIDLLANPAVNAAPILQYFGLTSQGDGTWKYGHPSDGSNLTVLDSTLAALQSPLATGERLHTLLEVAGGGAFPVKAPREPDFFEMLQAGIQPDSLGQGVADSAGSATAYLNTAGRDQNLARHVLQIGVNIIDQWGSGNDPTVIRRTAITSLSPANADPDICGIKNLPYIQLIGRTMFRRFDIGETGPSGATNYPHLTSFYQFQLWNPHQNASSAPAGTFRLVADGAVALHLANADRAGSGAAHDLIGQTVTYTSTGSNPDSIGFTLDSDKSGNKFSEPVMLLPGATGITSANTNNTYTHNKATILGFWQGDLVADYDGWVAKAGAASLPVTQRSYYERFGALHTGQAAGTTPPVSDPFNVSFVSNGFTAITSSTGLTFQLQKQDSGGNWRPVQTVPCILNNRLYTSDSYTTYNNVTAVNDSNYVDINPLCVDAATFLPDPRTIRFGAFTVAAGPKAGTTAVDFSARSFDFMGWLPQNVGKPVAAPAASVISASLLYANAPGSSAYYTDRGQAITRQGDFPSVSPYTAKSTGRPIMLNRRFHSVAELGYVFRDLPWRSLNFSRDDSRVTTATPEPTADAGLLDLFSATQSPVRAGVVNLNTAPAPVLTALLGGTALQPGSVSPDPTALTGTDGASLVAALQNYVGPRSSPTGNVIRTDGDIALALQSDSTVSTWPKPKIEAAIAALGDVHNARTWNLLFDVVAQAGRFPNQANVTSLADFVVSGQRHLLFQVAIDRYTGKIVDEILEPSTQVDLTSTGP